MPGVDDIDALLPQTQCTRCGYPGCRPYAEAILAAAAEIMRRMKKGSTMERVVTGRNAARSGGS